MPLDFKYVFWFTIWIFLLYFVALIDLSDTMVNVKNNFDWECIIKDSNRISIRTGVLITTQYCTRTKQL